MKIFINVTLFFYLLTNAAHSTQFAYCGQSYPCDGKGENRKAYSDVNCTVAKTSADWICELPSVKDLDPNFQADWGIRCNKAELKYCKATGDNRIAGPHDVPDLAWYSKLFDDTTMEVRCNCGCFLNDVRILTNNGWQVISKMAKNPVNMSLAIPTNQWTDGYKGSRFLDKSNFTVGEETEEVLRLYTKDGTTIGLTKKHPVIVVNGDKQEMIEASELIKGDTLVRGDGSIDSLVDITRETLPLGYNLVYNIDTKGSKSEDHILVANGLRMGDLKWQNILSSYSSRIKLLYEISTQNRNR